MEARGELQLIAEGSEAEIFAWEDGRVLRLLRNPDAQQKVEWEAHAMRAALAAGVRVPAVHGTTTVNGRPGLIMERIDGPDLLTLVGGRPWTVLSIGKTSGQLHARLHGVSAPDGIPALKARLAARIEASDLVPRHLAEFALSALLDLPDGDRLCHGDFHPGNIMMSDGEAVLIDWTDATRGDPNADLSRSSLLLRLGDTPPGVTLLLRTLAFVGRSILVSSYERAYRRPARRMRSSSRNGRYPSRRTASQPTLRACGRSYYASWRSGWQRPASQASPSIQTVRTERSDHHG